MKLNHALVEILTQGIAIRRNVKKLFLFGERGFKESAAEHVEMVIE